MGLFCFYSPITYNEICNSVTVFVAVLFKSVAVFSKTSVLGAAMALTDTGIKNLKFTDKAYRSSDSGGLFVWVTPAGGKLWRWEYRFESKRQLMSFGQYPDVGLAAVLEKHRLARSLLATGVNPMEKRKTDKVAKRTAADNSFQNIALLWLTHWRIGKSERHAEATQ
jgi:Arm DNA-binding domain